MWIIKASTLKEFFRTHPGARGPLVAWIKEIEAARYETPAQLKARYGSADFVGKVVVFNVGGNKYRLIAQFRYADTRTTPALRGIAYVLFIGTHEEYDGIEDVAALALGLRE